MNNDDGIHMQYQSFTTDKSFPAGKRELTLANSERYRRRLVSWLLGIVKE